MTDRERTYWDRRYRERDREDGPRAEPSPLVTDWLDALPRGRALDVATGAGRNAITLADAGYAVDAVDVSREGLTIARRRAAERDVDVEWIQADLDRHAFPEAIYDVIVVSFYRALDRLTDLKDALAPGGYLLYEHHLRTNDPVEAGPSTDRYRFGANELLRNCLDLTVLEYAERRQRREDRTNAVVTLVARNSTGSSQSYPER